jgi:hypothetical protein
MTRLSFNPRSLLWHTPSSHPSRLASLAPQDDGAAIAWEGNAQAEREPFGKRYWCEKQKCARKGASRSRPKK